MQRIPRLKPKNRTVDQLGPDSLAAALCHSDPGRMPTTSDQADTLTPPKESPHNFTQAGDSSHEQSND